MAAAPIRRAVYVEPMRPTPRSKIAFYRAWVLTQKRGIFIYSGWLTMFRETAGDFDTAREAKAAARRLQRRLRRGSAVVLPDPR